MKEVREIEVNKIPKIGMIREYKRKTGQDFPLPDFEESNRLGELEA